MKKYITIILISLFSILIVGCSNNKKNLNKTNFNVNEQASIDDIDIKLIKAFRATDDTIELVFEIKNNRKNSITLKPDTNFVMYDINKVQIPNTYSNDTNIIKSKVKTTYTVQYKVSDKELYEILFYSGIVDNNIKFTVTSMDIE